jgi:uncharacterized membrane protein
MVATSATGGMPGIRVNRIGYDAPWRWLDQGFKDFQRCAGTSLAYGSIFLSASLLLTGGLWAVGLGAWIMPFAGGFLLLGPLLATGLYEASRHLERGDPVSFDQVVRVSGSTFRQLAYMGFVLAFLYLAWLRIAMLLYALFINGQYYPFPDFIAHLLTTTNGMAFLGVGTAIGALIAFAAFAVSAVSIPMLMAEPVDVATAMLTSLAAVRRNPGPMLLWAWLIAAFCGLAMLTGFIGLVFVFPLIGHATWHAYRSLVPSSD